MNFPIWELPASGLLIAGVAIIHVFISHFAVGGGLFLVLAERKARRAAVEDAMTRKCSVVPEAVACQGVSGVLSGS